MTLIPSTNHQIDQPAVRWETCHFPVLQLQLIEFPQFALFRRNDGRIVRMECLDDHLAFVIVPAGTSRNLGKQGKSAFLTPKIREIHPTVRQHDPNEFHPGEIQSFRNHLGAQKNIYLPQTEILQYFTHLFFIQCAVSVQSDDACCGKHVRTLRRNV